VTNEAHQCPAPGSAIGTRGVARGTLVLVAITLAACLPAALLGNWFYGSAGAWAALAAAGLCLLGAVLGLAAITLFRGQRGFAGVLAGMLPRMFVPLVGALVIRVAGGPLYDAGALYFVIGFYLLTLAIETVWLLPNATAADRTSVPPQTA
jgi:hypothetical protein